MDEENETNEKNEIKTISKINKPYEIKEVSLEKKNPGFNLVSLKARNRLNLFKKVLTKYEYKDYIRKCKNMYSISSLMNNHYSMSDLYNTEKANIPDIIYLFNKIDDKLESKKVKFKIFKKNNIKNIQDNTSLYNNNENNNFNNELIKLHNNDNISKIKNNQESKEFLSKNNLIYFSSNKNNQNNSCEFPKNNIMNKTTSQIQKNKNENKRKNYNNSVKLKNHNISMINIRSYGNPENTVYNNILLNVKSKNKGINEKNIKKIIDKKYFNDSHKNKSPNLKLFSMPNRNGSYSITHFGGIIYNNSLYRNKSIENFLPNYCNLPLLYNKKK